MSMYENWIAYAERAGMIDTNGNFFDVQKAQSSWYTWEACAKAMNEPAPVASEVIKDSSGATWKGVRVAGWMWEKPNPVNASSSLRSYASHWSTGPAHAERLYKESDVEKLLEKESGDKFLKAVKKFTEDLSKKHAERKEAGEVLKVTVDVDSPATQVERLVHLKASRKGRIYIAGPMTGLPEYNFPAFNEKAVFLKAKGWTVENPAEHGHVKGAQWDDYLRWDITRIAKCEALYALPGWENSKGAQLEMQIAKALDLKIIYADGAYMQKPGVPDAEIEAAWRRILREDDSWEPLPQKKLARWMEDQVKNSHFWK